VSALYWSPVSSRSAAAAFASTWATLEAPGIAITHGWWIAQASATWAQLASCAAATSRSTSSSGASRARFSVRNSELAARMPPVGRVVMSYRPESRPCASGL